MKPKTFQKNVLNWFEHSGRKNLPWQKNITPYRVWVSEIMLQQTQVGTVIDYFNRFMAVFPTIHSLSKAPTDDVLTLWTGLGYYARARNLHKCAKLVCEEHKGKFPNTLDSLMALPGIGKSTAGAILSIAFQQPAAILDGNVKRVLQRFYGIETWYGTPNTLKKLWEIAENLKPQERTADYTQAMMDLGATLCTRSKPDCPHCPLKRHCIAYKENLTASIPAKKPKKRLPTKKTRLLMLENKHGEIYLEKRPNTGIWGGLWSFPEIPLEDKITEHCQQHLQTDLNNIKTWDSFKHTFSHYHLIITPVHATLKHPSLKLMAPEQAIWYNPKQENHTLGLSAPVKKLLNQLAEVTA